MIGRLDIAAGGLELEAEIHRRIDEGGDGGEGNLQLGRTLVEAEVHGEALFVHLQVPELVLQHDGHLVGKAFAQILADGDARGPGLESDVEMVLARQCAALAFHLTQYPSDNGAQGFLHDLVVGNEAVRRIVAHMGLGDYPQALGQGAKRG